MEITNEEFIKALESAPKDLNMTIEEIADELRISRTSVKRWSVGKGLPVQSMRKPIITWINKQKDIK